MGNGYGMVLNDGAGRGLPYGITMMKPLHIIAGAAIALSALAAAPYAAQAQTVRGLDSPGVGDTQGSSANSGPPSSFIIEPEAQIEGDRIKQQTYRSQAIGKNRNWDLDIGRFQAPIDEDPNGLAEDLEDSNYSGMRLRLPFRGRTGQ